MTLLARLLRAQEGSILVLGALALTAVLGMSGMGVEIANGYSVKVRNQRVADMAALGAAVAYKASQSIPAATATANDIIVANGLASSTAAVSQTIVGTTPAIQVVVTTAVPIRLAKVLTSNASYTVSDTAVAALASNPTAGCIAALSSGGTYGVTLTGGARMTATGCAVATNSGVSVPSGTSISAKQVTAGKSVYDQGAQWNQAGVTTTPTAGNIRQNQAGAASDTVGSDARLIAGFAKLGSYTAPAANANPTTPTGTDWSFDYNYSGPVAAFKSGNGTYSVPKGTYAIRTLTVAGGVTVSFAAGSTITISNGINNGGNGLTFGDGTLSINGGITTGYTGIAFGDSNVAVGSGTLNFTGTSSFGNGNVTMNGVLSLGGGTTVTMGSGIHSFNGISVSGGSHLTIGAGTLNVNGALSDDGGGSSVVIGAGTITIGRNASGNAITVSGGSSMSFGDGPFSANGGITTSGSSTLVFGVTASHYINGDLNLNGSATFGAGAYYVNGAFTNNTGGSMTGSGVTFFLTGTFTLSGGTSMTLSAPTSDSGGGVTDLLVATKSTAQTKLGGGSQNVYAGLVYAPNSDLVMDGGAGATGGGRCFMLVVSTISMNGGTTAGTACTSLGSSAASGTVALLR